MQRLKRIPARTIAAAALAALLALAVGAVADRGSGGGHGQGEKLLRATLAPSVPTDPTIHAVTPGAAPWVLRDGELSLTRRGRFELRVRGLVIPSPPGDGTPGPVTTISASLYCAPDANPAPADTSPAVPISRRGNARIRDRFTLPEKCLAPTVLVHPNGDTTRYIAAEGFES
jgi:hypothetical protein